jgi:outer membrane receptor for ferric coprogen and ferric-rhodotorulic acid
MTSPYRSTRLALAVRAALGGLPLMAAPFAAQAAPSASELRSYDIPAGPLAGVLSRFAGEAGIPLSVDATLTDGKTSNGLRGSCAVDAALKTLLAGTGLEATTQANGSYTLRLATPGEATLKTVTVQSAAWAETTEGTRSYTTGATASATRLNLALRQTPQSVSVVTRQQMDDQGLSSVAKVLERTVGVTLNQAETDRVFPIVRGFQVTNIQYDGVPSEAGGSYDDDMLVDTVIYDRIEIVRGATGLLTGVGSPSAAINLVRKRPTTEARGYVLGAVGRWNNYRVELDVSGALLDSGSVRGRFVGAYQQRDSYIDAYGNDRTVLYGTVEADLTASTLLTLGLDYQNSETDGVTYGEPVPLFFADGGRTHFSRSTTTGNDWAYLDKRRLISFVALEQQLGAGWLGKMLYTYVDGDLSNRMIYLSGYPDRATGEGMNASPNSFDSAHRQSAVDLYAIGPFHLFGRAHELVVGWSYNEDKTDRKARDELSVEPMGSFYDWSAYPSPVFGDFGSLWGWQTRQDGGYATTRLQLTDAFKLILGARISNVTYSQHSEFGGTASAGSVTYSSEITPYAGMVYDFAEFYSAYASYTEIFQVQSERDREGTLLDPLTGTNYEAGIKGAFLDDRLNASVALFKIEQDNFAIPDIMVNGEQRYRAISGTEVRGYELEISGEPLPRWSLAGGFTRRIAKDADGASIQTIEPQQLLRLSSSYRLTGNLEKLTLGGHVSWQSRIYNKTIGPNSETAEQDAYMLVDAFGIYQATEQLTLQINLNNVFDKTYYKSVGFYGGGYYGEPRAVMASVKYRL